MKCPHCAREMKESTTTFTVVRKRQVYVVENVPCFECDICGHISYGQDVAKSLETYTSGRAVPFDTSYKTFAYRWNVPVVEIPKFSPTQGYATATPNFSGTPVFILEPRLCSSSY